MYMLRNPFLETILLQKLDRIGELQPPQSLQQGLPAVNPVQEEHHRISSGATTPFHHWRGNLVLRTWDLIHIQQGELRLLPCYWG